MHLGQLRTYTMLIHRCRRFFPPGADEEIWDACWPAMPHIFLPQSFEVWPRQCAVWCTTKPGRPVDCAAALPVELYRLVSCLLTLTRSLQAFGWLVLLLPTHGLWDEACDAAVWNKRLDALMALQEAFSASSWWSGQCLGLIARMAKHDVHGTPSTGRKQLVDSHATAATFACIRRRPSFILSEQSSGTVGSHSHKSAQTPRSLCRD